MPPLFSCDTSTKVAIKGRKHKSTFSPHSFLYRLQEFIKCLGFAEKPSRKYWYAIRADAKGDDEILKPLRRLSAKKQYAKSNHGY